MSILSTRLLKLPWLTDYKDYLRGSLDAAKKLAQEKEEFASIFGGSATGGGTELVQDVTDKKVVADAASVECEAGLIWCETTLQCIDPKILLCASIQVVKGKHFMDSVVQGEKSALVFHDSEAQGQHESKWI